MVSCVRIGYGFYLFLAREDEGVLTEPIKKTTSPYYKKSYKEKLKDALTKPFDQIYARHSKPEKVVYWFVVIAGFSAIGYIWIFKLKIF